MLTDSIAKEYRGHEVAYISNFTTVDKIINRAKEEASPHKSGG